MSGRSRVWSRPVEWIPDPVERARSFEAGSRSVLSPLLIYLYSVHRLRKLCSSLCLKLEHGPFYTKTLRQVLARFHGVEIGPYSYGPILQPGFLPRGIRVGAYCSVGTELIVRRRDHPVDRLTQHPFFYNRKLGYLAEDSIPADEDNPLTIGNDVWIGDRVTILSGCRHIGNGAVIAAGAVVTRDVAPYCVTGGVPARVFRKRFGDDVIDQLELSRWWELPLDELLEFKAHLLVRVTPEVLHAITADSRHRPPTREKNPLAPDGGG